MSERPEPLPSLPDSPPRAFTQGVGTVFQFAGVTLFLAMMSVCCISSLLSSEVASRADRMRIGWHFPGDPADAPTYSYARAMTMSVAFGVFFGMAMAGVGLGLQAERKASPWVGVIVTGFATIFWITQMVFAIHPLDSVWLALLALVLAMFFGAMLSLAIGALKEMLRTPPPADQEILPLDYKVPYSHMHQDPPEIRLAQELQQRRERLAVQQKELEMLEKKLKRKFEKEDR
jgi:lysylphosphatidylglycerol synthetase-like protein (DUF2156 family)